MRSRVAPRRRRVGLTAPRRLRPPHAARSRPRAGALRAGPRGARCSRRRWRALLPHPLRPGRPPPTTMPSPRPSGTSCGPGGSPVTPSLRCGPCSAAGARPTGRTATGPRRTRYAGRRGPLGGLGAAPATTGAAHQVGPGTGHRALVPAPPGGPRSDGARLCHGRAPPRPTRHPHPRRDGRRGRPRRVRRDLPCPRSSRGGGPGPSRVLRRGPRCVPVRHHRCRRPPP